MMGTRAAAFAGKISNLRDSILRIQNGTMPQPTCIDLSNMLKYFCQVFNDFRDFKDIENITLYANEKRDQLQLIRTLPNFDYSGLYKTLAQLVDILPLIPQPSNGYEQLCNNLLLLFECLVPFLDHANMETMPYLVTTLFVSFPVSMHKCILDALCFNLLPFTIDQQQRNTARMLRKAKRNADKLLKKGQELEKQRQQTQPINNHRPTHCIVRIEDSSETTPATKTGVGGGGGGRNQLSENDDIDQKIDLDCNDEQQQQASAMYQKRSLEFPDDRADQNEDSMDDEDDYALMSVTSILVVSFHYIQEPMHHSQLIECLMKLKSNVFEDLLYVIAYGTTRARCPAVEILFRYWPDICPNQADRKNNNQSVSKLKHIPWQPKKCQNKCCSSTALDDDEAVKMCLDFKISITLSGLPPPMLVCLDCVDRICKQQFRGASIAGDNELVASGAGGVGNPIGAGGSIVVQEVSHRSQARATAGVLSGSVGVQQDDSNCMQALDDHGSKFLDLLLPMERIAKLCENKKCRSTQDRTAIGTCFDIECASYNGKKPIRYCKTCFISIHEPCETNDYDVTLQNHIRHSSLNLNIMNSDENINNFVEAIISLLKEAAPAEKPSKESERYLRSLMGPMSQFSSDNKDTNTIATEEKQLISQYGIWLMTGLCKNVERLSDELLGRLLGMLFQWFHFTACLPDDQAGSALEKLKGECIKGWITEVKTKRLDVFISCLLPHPIDCSKIGGHWEVWPDNAHQIKEGFKRLLCLVPYDIITDDVWDEIMPHWMECFRHEVPENELSELKILLSKVFDPELSPLGFETKQMYNFISSRFEDSTNTNQEQTLYWLQIITMLEIPIPINFLYQMLRSGVKSLADIRANELNRLKMVNRLNELNKQATARKSKQRKIKQQQQQHKPEQSEVGSSSGVLAQPTSSETRVDSQTSNRNSEEVDSLSECSTASGDDDEDDDDDDDDEDDDDHSQMSVAEDDVLLPDSSEQINDNKHDNERADLNKPMTRQERQAQARAAFSAKLYQHATMLEAQQGIVSAHSTSALSTPAGSVTPSQSIMLTGGGTTSSGQQQQPTKSHTTSQLAPLASSNVSTTVHTTTSLAPSSHPIALNSTSSALKEVKKSTTTTDDGSNRTKVKKPAKPKLKLNLDSMDDYGTLSKIDNNLVCYILMMDILLKQLDLQEITSHRGLDGKEAQQAIELLNAIISTPWLGKHTCCDSLPYTGSSSPSSGQPASSSTGSQNTFSASSMKQMAESPSNKEHHQQQQQTKSGGIGDVNRQDALYSNIHSFSHCAQGFEHEDSYETCVFCEIISTFFQLSMSLVEFFSPVIEVSICEVSQDAANGEFDGKPDYSRIGLDHLGPSPKDMNAEFDFNQTQTSLNRLQHQQDPTSPFSPSYSGPTLKQEVLETLPKELQLSYNLLVQFHQYQTPDIVSQLLQMIKLISLHSQVLSKASKLNPQFISWCQHNMLVNKLWSLCQLESSEIARTCVPLLLHCITLPWGVRLFRDLVERDFNSNQWLSRFRAVERVVTIAYFCEPSTIKNSTLLQSTMASAFCYVVRCLDDIEAIVAQRALISLEMMKTSSLKLLLWCLEVQFDYIIIDRSIILRSVFQLYNHLRDRRFLTWDFFLNRFDTIFMEAQIYLQQTGEIPSFTMQDLKNTNTKSEIYQRKIARAREALQETHHSRSLSSRFQESKFMQPTSSGQGDKPEDSSEHYKQSIKLQQSLHQKQQQLDSLGSDLQQQATPNTLSPATISDSKQTGAGASGSTSGAGGKLAASPLRRVLQHGRSTSSRYQSVAFLTSQSLAKRKNSKFMSNLAMQSVPPLMSLPDKLHQHLPNSFVDDSTKLNEIAQENHVFGVVHRVCDEDRDTNHSLIFLLMQFFSKPDPSHPQSIKTLNRSHQIVLRHLNILMGYSVARKNYLISASNLRLLPVFNAFLTSLPKVLDFNYTLGTILLDTCLPVLIYCPATDNVQFDQIDRPKYSLWLLNPLMRQSWLSSVMTFLYKYQFNQPHLKAHVNMLIWIIINTLESHLNYALAEVIIPPATPVSAATAGSGPPAHQSSGGGNGQSPAQDSNAKSGTSAQRSIEQPAPPQSPPQLDDTNTATTTATTSIDQTTRAQLPAVTTSAQVYKSHETIELRDVSPSSSKDTSPHLTQLITSPKAAKALKTFGLAGSSTPTTRPTIVKADTSDNLTSKSSNFFQRKMESSASGSIVPKIDQFKREQSTTTTTTTSWLNLLLNYSLVQVFVSKRSSLF
uniref:Protein unc-79 n=2 Tax=Aceria tosichella TaxID=561515 RepID=A0A6G1S3Y4_9ACAR